MMLPPFRSVGSVTLNIIRPNLGEYVDGRWVENVQKQQIKIIANVQPNLTKQDTMLLSEGDRSRRALRVYTSYDLRGRQEGASAVEGDRFVWTDGHTYEIMQVFNYQMGVLNHTKAIAVRRELT